MSISIVPNKEEFEVIQTIAKAANDSTYFTKMGGYPGMLSIALYAREMGIPPLCALFGGMQNVMGKIQMSPEMMMSLIRQKGHIISILEATDVICRIKGTRKDTSESYIASYQIQEAEKAGLIKPGSGWAKNPSDMLFARASGRLKRRLFPDIATKAYCEGELEEIEHTVEIAPPPELISKEQADQLTALIGDDLEYHQNLLKYCKVESFNLLPASRFEKILLAVQKHNEKRLQDEVTNAQDN